MSDFLKPLPTLAGSAVTFKLSYKIKVVRKKIGQNKKLKVAVLMGGPSTEHEVSLNTGQEIIKHLDPQKYNPEPIFITKKGRWLFEPPSQKLLSAPKNRSTSYYEKKALEKLRLRKPDVAFIAMHGAYGEDGTIQGLLEILKIPYTGSGVLASALGMDKPRANAIFQNAGLNVPKFELISRNEKSLNLKLKDITQKFHLPFVVKPANHGSSVGVHIVRHKKILKESLKDALRYSEEAIVQKFIPGREFTCGVFEDKRGNIKPLPPTEIVPLAGNFYDYRSKYATGGSRHIVPPQNLTRKIVAEIQRSAGIAHKIIGCKGMSRSDFILGKNGKLYILEINTIPGMTATSLLPEAAKSAGIGFSKLLDIIIQAALRRQNYNADVH